jgi:hypothetical protein
VSSHLIAPMRSSGQSCSGLSRKSTGKKRWRSRKKSNTRCSSIICGQAVADRTSNGGGELCSGPLSRASRHRHQHVTVWYQQCRSCSLASLGQFEIVANRFRQRCRRFDNCSERFKLGKTVCAVFFCFGKYLGYLFLRKLLLSPNK